MMQQSRNVELHSQVTKLDFRAKSALKVNDGQ